MYQQWLNTVCDLYIKMDNCRSAIQDDNDARKEQDMI